MSLIRGQKEVKQAIPSHIALQEAEEKLKRRGSNGMYLMVSLKLSIPSGAHGGGAECVQVCVLVYMSV